MTGGLLPCPKCGNPAELELDSSSAAEASWIVCGWCEHKMQARCDEETLSERWNKLSRRDMPAFDLDAEMDRLECTPHPPKGETP